MKVKLARSISASHLLDIRRGRGHVYQEGHAFICDKLVGDLIAVAEFGMTVILCVSLPHRTAPSFIIVLGRRFSVKSIGTGRVSDGTCPETAVASARRGECSRK